MAALLHVNRARLEVASPELVHRRLNAFNGRRLCPGLGTDDDAATEVEESGQRFLERLFVDAERDRIQDAACEAPSDVDEFVAWFAALEQNGPGQHDPLFDWLESRASREEMTWFLRQEAAGEAGFDDLVAMTQVKMPARVKLEMGRNYWDELGQGHEGGMHGPMLARLTHELGIAPSPSGGLDIVWESLALANLMVALATHRLYAYQSIGALGVIELTAPGRAEKVNNGLKRLGVGGDARRYFALHATLDLKHSETWNAEVISPLVAADPRFAHAIAEGALMRLAAGARCFARYRQDLGVDRSAPRAS